MVSQGPWCCGRAVSGGSANGKSLEIHGSVYTLSAFNWLQNTINFINRVAFGSPEHLVMFKVQPHHLFQQHPSQKPFKKAEKAFTREVMILNFNRMLVEENTSSCPSCSNNSPPALREKMKNGAVSAVAFMMKIAPMFRGARASPSPCNSLWV